MRTSAILVVLLICLLGGSVQAADGRGEEDFVGRPLADVLDDLRGEGLKLIYSSDVVTPEMVVASAPKASRPGKILREVLAPHRLTTEAGPGGTILILREATDEPPAFSSIHGTIIDVLTGKPLAGARIEALGTGVEVSSDSEGRFELRALPVGIYTLVVRLPGFVIQRMDNVRVVLSTATRLDFRLRASPEVIDNVVVTPSAYRLYGDEPQTSQSMTRQEIEQTPNLADDVNRAVARLPGIANPDMTSNLYIRGGADDEVLYLVDGMELFSPFHFEPHLSMFSITNSRAVQNLDVSTGGFSAVYGDRMSGVLDLSSTTPSGPTSNSLGVSFINAHFVSEGTFDHGRGEWLAAVKYGYMEIILGIVGDGNDEVAPRYGDVMAKVRYRLTDRTTLGASTLVAANRFQLFNEKSYGQVQEIDASQDNLYAWLTLETVWSPRLFSRTLLYTGGLERAGVAFDHQLWEQTSSVDDTRNTEFNGLKQNWTVEASDRHMLRAGFDAKSLVGEYDYHSQTEITDPIVIGTGAPIVKETDIVTRREGWDLAAFVSDQIRIARPFTLELGLRWDSQTYTDDDALLSPRINLLYRATDRDAIRLAWGVFGQSQWIHELRVQDGVEDFFPAQRSQNVVLGYEHGFAGGVSLGVEAYHKGISTPWPRFENLFHPRDGIPELESDRVRIDPDSARAYGIELFTRRMGPGRFGWWFGYVWSRAEDEIDGDWVLRSWDQTHAVTASFNYRIGRRWNFNASGLYHTGWPTTQVSANLVQDPDGTWRFEPYLGSRNATRYPDFHRLDVRASRDFSLKRSEITLYLEIINLLGSDNPIHGDDFGYRARPDGSVETERYYDSAMPRIPSFGVTWVF